MAGYNKAYPRDGELFGGTGGNTDINFRPADTTKSHFAYNLNGTSNKYVTAYNNSTEMYYGDFTVGDVSHTGDAIQEVWVRDWFGWFSDYSDFVNIDTPFFARGRQLFSWLTWRHILCI